MREHVLKAAAIGIALAASVRAADLKSTKVTVLARENTFVIERALVGEGELLVPVENVEAITGFKIKPEGMCVDDLCIPIPADSGWLTDHAGAKYFNLTKFADKVDQVYAVDAENSVWSFTAVPRAQTAPLMAGQAPDFALPDRTGKTVRLSDFRGKKVLIITWASW
jgi:hypothetical protein